MSTSYIRDVIIELYKSDNRTPPQEVIEAEPNDVFSFGGTISKNGFGYGPLRKTGSMVDGKYVPDPNPKPFNVHPFISITPYTEQEIADLPNDPPITPQGVYKDIREWMTAAATHKCEGKVLTSVNEQGNSIFNTFVSFQCTCGVYFKIALQYLKATKIPMRKYITTIADRIETARRLTVEPETTLLEMIESGGWDQVNPKAAIALMMAGALGPPGNEHEKGLHEWMAGTKPEDTSS